MLFHNIQGAGGFSAAAPSGISASYLTSSYQDTALTTYTFSSLSLGATDSTRKIVVFVSGRHTSSRTVSSVTVAGVSATLVGGNVLSQDLVAAWVADVPSGTSGDVVVTLSGAGTRCGVNLYRLVNSEGIPRAVLPVASTDYSVVTPSANSVVLAMALNTGLGHPTNIVWTGLTEDVDSNWSTFTQTSTASGSFSTIGSKTISIDAAAERGIVLCFTGSPAKSLIDIITDLSLTSNLKLVLDAGDSDSYNPSTQTTQWLDTSGLGYDFFRGATGSSEASDPTFNGSAGGLSASEYWSFDGGDYFTYESTQPAWVNSLSVNGAQWSMLAAVYFSSSTLIENIFTNRTNTNNAAAGISIRKSSTNTFEIRVSAGDPNAATITVSSATIPTSQWVIIGCSVDENGGATASVVVVNPIATTFNGAYTYPATTASGVGYITSNGTVTTDAFKNGSRLGCLAFWQGGVLSSTNLTNLYAELGLRFGV